MKLLKTLLISSLLLSSLFAAEKKVNVLVALEETPYKEALTTELVKLLEDDEFTVVLEKDHETNLTSYSAEDYDVIFITNSGVKSMVRPWVVEWLETNSEYESQIILHTTKTKKWSEKVSVDAVSSASNKKNAESDAKTYYDLIVKKLSK